MRNNLPTWLAAMIVAGGLAIAGPVGADEIEDKTNAEVADRLQRLFDEGFRVRARTG